MFARIGEGTDVVGKEMYEFFDRSEPPSRAAARVHGIVCRAFAQHRPTTPWKVWYQGPFFPLPKHPKRAATASSTRSARRRSAPTTQTPDVEIIALAAEFSSDRSACSGCRCW